MRLTGRPASIAWRRSSEFPSRAASNIRFAKLMVSAGRLLALGVCAASLPGNDCATLDTSVALRVTKLRRLYGYAENGKADHSVSKSNSTVVSWYY